MIADFVIDKMSAYIAGETKPETAAGFTSGELAAIYKGDHYSRDASGALRITPLPEALDIDEAMTKADAVLAEILRYFAGKMATKNPAPIGTDTKPSGTVKKSGLEGLKNYARGNTV